MIIGSSRPSSKWQIVIPKEVRKEFSVGSPSRVTFIFEKRKGAVELRPEKIPHWKELAGKLSGKAIVPYKTLRSYKKIDDLIGKAVVADLLQEL